MYENRLKHTRRSRLPSLIVIHAMAEFIKMNDDRILRAVDLLDELKLSAHYLVHPDGSVSYLVDPIYTARHAYGVNSKSIGIEVLVPGLHNYGTFIDTILNDPYWCSHSQVVSTKRIVRSLKEDFPITAVKTHQEVDKRRKKLDPGPHFPMIALH